MGRMKRQKLKPTYVTWILKFIKVAVSTIHGMGAGAGYGLEVAVAVLERTQKFEFLSSFAEIYEGEEAMLISKTAASLRRGDAERSERRRYTNRRRHFSIFFYSIYSCGIWVALLHSYK